MLIASSNEGGSFISTITFGAKIDDTLPSGSYSTTLHFVATADVKPATHTIAIKPGTGITSVQIDEEEVCDDASDGCDYELTEGSSHTLKATATFGYEFEQWTKTSGEGVLSNETSDSEASFTVGAGIATLTAVGKTSSMQGITKATCPSDATSVTDVRDGQSYEIAKLNDGNCWMLENLRFGAKPLLSGVTISSDNTNNPVSTFTSIPSTSTSFSYLVASDYTTAYINTASAENSLSSGFGTGWKYGVFYNFCAASAGTMCEGQSNTTQDAPGDICPKGWHMPTQSEWNTLWSNATSGYNSNITNFRNALKLPLSGYWYRGSLHDQSASGGGDFWSRSRYSSGSASMYFLSINSSSADPASNHNRTFGFSVRCVMSS